MRTPQYLDISDPRLGLTITQAKTNDIHTKFASIAVQQCLAGCENRAISAPSIGIPINVLGIKSDGQFFSLSNPQLIHVEGSLSTLTAPFPYVKNLLMKYVVPDRMRIIGTLLEGHQVIVEVPDNAKIDVLHAFSLLHSGDVKQWLTPYQKSYLKLRNTAAENLFLNVGNNLLLAKSMTSFQQSLRIRDDDGVEILGVDGSKIGTLNWREPNRPQNPTDLALLFLLARMGVKGGMYFSTPHCLSLALALSMAWLGSKVFFPDKLYPLSAISALGVNDYIVPASQMKNNNSDLTEAEYPCGVAFIDLRNGKEISDINLKMLNSILHPDGCLAIFTSEANEAYEKSLQKKFSYVYSFQLKDSEILYIARKNERHIGLQRAYAFDLCLQLFLDVNSTPYWVEGSWLHKDGRKLEI